MTDLSGTSFGRYQLLEQIGLGGMGVVYKALDTHLDSPVAIKFLRTERLSLEMLDRTL
jgi:serine/threonine protein kinase